MTDFQPKRNSLAEISGASRLEPLRTIKSDVINCLKSVNTYKVVAGSLISVIIILLTTTIVLTNMDTYDYNSNVTISQENTTYSQVLKLLITLNQ